VYETWKEQFKTLMTTSPIEVHRYSIEKGETCLIEKRKADGLLFYSSLSQILYSPTFHRQKALREIYETEREFVFKTKCVEVSHDLRRHYIFNTSITLQHKVLLKSLQATPGVLSESEIKALFCNYDVILEAHLQVNITVIKIILCSNECPMG